MDLDRDEIRRRLKAARELKDIPNHEALAAWPGIADHRGMSVSTIKRWEGSGRPPTRSQLDYLAEALGLPDWFFTEPNVFGRGAPTPSSASREMRVVERALAAIDARLDELETRLADRLPRNGEVIQMPWSAPDSEPDEDGLEQETAAARGELDDVRDPASDADASSSED